MSRPLPVAAAPPPVLAGRPDGVPALTVLGVDVWAGERFETAGGEDYVLAWAKVATSLWVVGVDPSYAWGASDVGYLVTEQNQEQFSEFDVTRYRAAVRTQQITPGDGDVAVIVDAIPAVLRRTVVEILTAPGPQVARRGVNRVFDQAVREGVDLDDYKVIAAFLFDTLYTWLAAAGTRGADPQACLDWVTAHLGPQAGQDAGHVVAALGGGIDDDAQNAANRVLGERHTPTLAHLVAAAGATAGNGDVAFLDGADPTYYTDPGDGEPNPEGDAT